MLQLVRQPGGAGVLRQPRIPPRFLIRAGIRKTSAPIEELRRSMRAEW